MAEGLPPLVARALVLAERLCFERPCRPGVGRLLAALRPGGMLLLLDDLTPQRLGTAEQRARWDPDPVCAFWFRHPRVAPASGVPDATPVASGCPSAVLLTTAAGRLSGGPARGRRSAAALGAATAQVAGASGRRSTATRSAPAGSGREGLPLSPGRAALPPWSAPGQADARVAAVPASLSGEGPALKRSSLATRASNSAADLEGARPVRRPSCSCGVMAAAQTVRHLLARAAACYTNSRTGL
jgi:hypothetical protein